MSAVSSSRARPVTGMRLLVVRHAQPVRELRVRRRTLWRVGMLGFLTLWGVPLAVLAGIAAQARDDREVLARDVEVLTTRAEQLSTNVAALESNVAALEKFAGVHPKPAAVGGAPDARPTAAIEATNGTDSWFDDLERRIATVRNAVQHRVDKMRSTPLGTPVRARLSSGFGWRSNPFSGRGSEWHSGLDFPAPIGTPVRATANGTVEFAERRSGYGLAVSVRHADGYSTLFGHLSAATVRAGQKVTRGEVVGRVGNEGRSTGPHVHYEVRRHGKPMDPRRVPASTSTPLSEPPAAPDLQNR
jgi:murein DD-endopeptidase MepM/ murein hydrolase activator NlpD